MGKEPTPREDVVRNPGLTWRGILLVPVVSTMWFVLFAAGLCIDSTPFRDALNGGAEAGGIIGTWFAVLTCYTPTNIALLAVLASVLGALGSKATLQPDPTPGDGEGRRVDKVNPYLSGVLRGFFVYLILIAGMLVLVENPFSAPSPEQYVRLAGLVSVFGFMTSYDPNLFGSVLTRIGKTLQKTPAGEDGTP